MIRNIIVRLILTAILVGLGFALWFHPLITLAVLYPLSWWLLSDQFGPYGEEVRVVNGVVVERRVFRPTWGENVWKLITAPFVVIFFLIFVIIAGGVPML